jgi:hypothetical protein
LVRRLSIEDEDRKFIFSEFRNNRLPPDGYVVTVTLNGATMKRLFSKKEKVSVNRAIPMKKIKKEFNYDQL